MSLRRTFPVVGSVVIVLVLLLLALPAATLAQNAAATTAPAAAATAGAPATTPGTPTATRTPAPTPTPTATLTELQARLLLARAFLEGKDYDRAAELFADIAADDRGNVEALEGLAQALAGKAAVQATMIAPYPTEVPEAAPAAETLGTSVGKNLREIGGAALAVLLVLLALYFLAHLLRWLLGALRELWCLRILPLLGRPAVPPGYLIGEFANTLGPAGAEAAAIVPQALTETLVQWNQLVADKQLPVEPAPALQPGPLAWLSILWRWLFPGPRGYRVSGLLRGSANSWQLAVQRAALARNTIDRSATFVSALPAAPDAYAALAGEAAKWLIAPDDIESSPAAAPTAKSVREFGAPTPATSGTANASRIFDEAVALLLPVRQQVTAGDVNFPAARAALDRAQALVQRLPSGSSLRGQLEGVIADLRKSVPG